MNLPLILISRWLVIGSLLFFTVNLKADEISPQVARDPSDSTTSSASTWSTVRPKETECAPHELLAIIPPSVARLEVATSEAK